MKSDSINHIFLTQAETINQAHNKVRHFLEHTELIRYEAMTIDAKASINGSEPSFWTEVDQGVAMNRQFTKDLIGELEGTGVRNLSELKDLPQGYPSKVLHTLVHILDGFIGVDSAFYNLLEDSHWLSPQMREKISKEPGTYWLVPVKPGKIKYSVLQPMANM